MPSIGSSGDGRAVAVGQATLGGEGRPPCEIAICRGRAALASTPLGPAAGPGPRS